MKLTAIILLFAGLAAAQNTPVFPTRAATNGDLFVATNNFATTLLTGITSATATSATVASATGLTIPAMVTIDTEIFAVCQVTGNTLTFGKSSCPNADGRGYDGSVAVNHVAGRPVEARVVAGLHNQAAAEVIAIEQATPNMVSDIPCTSTLAACSTAASSASRYLAVSRSWTALPSQTITQPYFVKGGMLQAAAGQTITMPCPVAGNYRIFDISLGGAVAFSNSCDAPAEWWGADATGAASSFPMVQSALQSSGGKTILHFHAGTWKLTYPASGNITPTTGAVISCDPGAEIDLYDSDAALKDLFTFTGEWNGAAAISGSCRFVQHTTISPTNEVFVINANGLTLDGFTIDGTLGSLTHLMHGIRFNNTSTARTIIRNCHFVNMAGSPLFKANSDTGQNDNITLENCTSEGNQTSEDFAFNTPAAGSSFTNIKISHVTCKSSPLGFCLDFAAYPSGKVDGITVSDVQISGYAHESIHSEKMTNASFTGLNISGCPTASSGTSMVQLIAGTDHVAITGSTFDLTSCASSAVAVLATSGGAFPVTSRVTITGNTFDLGAFGRAFIPLGVNNAFSSNVVRCGGAYSGGTFSGASVPAVLTNTVGDLTATGNAFTGCYNGFGRDNPDTVPTQIAATDSVISGNTCQSGGVCINVINPGQGLIVANNSANNSVGVITNTYRNSSPGAPGFAQFLHNTCDTCANTYTDGTPIVSGLTWTPTIANQWYYIGSQPTEAAGTMDIYASDSGPNTLQHVTFDYAEVLGGNGVQIFQRLDNEFNIPVALDQVAASCFADNSCGIYLHTGTGIASPVIRISSSGRDPLALQTPVAAANPSTKAGTTVVQTVTLPLARDGIAATSFVVAPGLPASKGPGGLYVCVDASGFFYKKASCP